MEVTYISYDNYNVYKYAKGHRCLMWIHNTSMSMTNAAASIAVGSRILALVCMVFANHLQGSLNLPLAVMAPVWWSIT